MLTALSNALQTPIIVFSSMVCHPILCIEPTKPTVHLPLLVAYNQSGPGHFDAVSPITEGNPDIVSVQVFKCSCGKNTKSSVNNCGKQHTKYTTIIRCPCLKRNVACNEMCRCRDCGNPCGVRPSHKPIRKRFKHKWQEHTQICSAEFATQRNETLQEGSITKFEFFVMVNITNYCEEENIDLSTENILSIYNQIATVAKDRNYTSTLRPLTPPIVNTFLNQHEKNLEIFKELCQMQLEWNITKET